MLPKYSMPLYRPPSEADSLLIQVTLGCPHNRCTFCPMYKGIPFRTRPEEEVLAEIDAVGEHYGDRVRTVFLPDGNTIVLKTAKLLPILKRLKQKLPKLERITCYGSARFILRKTVQDLIRLREAGLSRIHMGIESGDENTLVKIQKGASPEEMIEAGRRVREAGIEISEYVLVGIAGPERSGIHAQESARVLNAIEPTFIRLRTFVPAQGTPLFDEYEQGKFTLMTAHQCLEEIKILVENLQGSTRLVSDHISNYADVSGTLPKDKATILARIDACLATDEGDFRGSLFGYQL